MTKKIIVYGDHYRLYSGYYYTPKQKQMTEHKTANYYFKKARNVMTKKIIISLLGYILSGIIIYGIGCFISQEANPENWLHIGRAIAGISWAAISILIPIIIVYHD